MASLIGISITLLAGFLLFGPSGRDDVYMTLWPALQFSEHGHIVNYNGEALEQSSSLLHVVVLGSLHSVLGGNIVDLNFVFVLILGLASGWLSLILGKKLGLPLLPLALALSGNACFTYWSMGGLDAVIAAFCWLLFALAYLQTENKRKWPAIGFAFVLLLLIRPENGFVLALLFGFLVLFIKANTTLLILL